MGKFATGGMECDTNLYQTFIGASYGQEKLAQYVLRVTRHDMLKVQPAMRLTEIFAGLLNCCVRARDARRQKISKRLKSVFDGVFVMERVDYPTGGEVFKNLVKSEQNELEELLVTRIENNNVENNLEMVVISNKELVKRTRHLQAPVGHWVERVKIAPKIASMLNLLALSYIREIPMILDQEKRSDLGTGSKERLREAQIMMHYLTGETKRR
ncbi:hypothetical protein BGX27_010196 [Mortierella sp. AM989]|nr:hypothetical protein BGX27_010196 [Mortierella sp. AM989]